MSDRRHHSTFRNGKHRKLPSIPSNRRHVRFQPTFRCAIDWLQRHKDVLDTCVSMMDLYPKLLQHRSCDTIWNFITKVAFLHRQDVQNLTKYHSSGRIQDNKGQIPEISVSGVSGDNMSCYDESERTPKTVFVCGNVADEKWFKLIVGLAEQYAIRCSKSVEPETDDTKLILRSDAVLFLFDNKSICERQYIEQLGTALQKDKPVIYVRDLGCSLPDPLPTDGHNNNNNTSSSFISTPSSESGQRQDNNSEKAHLADKHIYNDIGSHSSASVREFKDSLFLASTDYLRSDSNLSNASTKSCPPASNFKESLSDQATHARTPSPAHRLPSYTTKEYLQPNPALPVFEMDFSFASQKKATVDITEAIKTGFQTATIYDKNHHNRSMDNLCAAIETGYGLFMKAGQKDMEFVRADFPSDHLLDNSYSRSSTRTDKMPFPDWSTDTSNDGGREWLAEPADTVYMVCPDGHGTDVEPKLVHYPKECVSGDLSSSPSIESFGFQDIDLSKRINELDLFSEEGN